MDIPALYAILSVVSVSLISIIGLAFISIKEKFLSRIAILLVSLAIGALIGDAFLHLIPDALEEGLSSATVAFLTMAGMLTFFILEKVLGHHHHHELGSGEEYAKHMKIEHSIEPSATPKKPVGQLIMFADGVHNFVDGIIIGASYLVSIELGVASTLAIILHEIPQEVGDFGVLLYAGYSKGQALLYNFFSALTAAAGTALALLVGAGITDSLLYTLPFAAGTFIYIANSDLVPELHRRHTITSSIFQVIFIVIGIGAMYLLLSFE